MRLDNGHPTVLSTMRVFAHNWRFWSEHQHDENDPGKTPPVDICRACWHGIVWAQVPPDATDVAHPPYEELNYKCAICNEPLTAEDNGY